jgi:hypothetical protein
MQTFTKTKDRQNFVRFLMLYLLTRVKSDSLNGMTDSDIKGVLKSVLNKKGSNEWDGDVNVVVNFKSIMLLSGHIGLDNGNLAITENGENTMYRLKQLYALSNLDFAKNKIMDLSQFCDNTSKYYVSLPEEKVNAIHHTKKMNIGKMV